MAWTSGRRSRALDSDDEGTEPRESTPASTAPNDRKRARRSLLEDETPSRDSPPQNGPENPPTARKESKPLLANGAIATKPKHQPGAIVRVKLTNFVTYTSAEFFPGPSLNMVIGPNGTGKSTLVCAICLGLGWGTGVLGRAKDASEFVKHGSSEATIEIELQRSTSGEHKSKQNPIFTRTIKRDGNKSTYLLNGEGKSQKFIQELARRFDIQIDNLCQFLPQDKVVEFAAMTPIELLQSTQQAAAPPEMLQWHYQLKELRARQKNLLIENKSDKESLANLQDRQEMNRVDVEKMREKIEVEKRVTWLKKCRPIPQYAEAQKKAREAKQKQKQLVIQLKKLKEELAPTLRKVNAKGEYLKTVEIMRAQREKDVAAAETKCEKIDKEDTKLSDKINECDVRAQAERRSRQPKRQEALKFQQSITQLKAQIEQRPEEFDSRAINAQVQQKTDEKREIEARAGERVTNMQTLNTQRQDRYKQIERLQGQLAALDTQSGQQANKLERASRDTYRAWKWIQENKDQFEKEVFGPPIVSCSLKDPKMADQVESFFQPNDFRIITFQTKNDFARMQREARRQDFHDVSLRVCSIDSLDSFRPALSTERLHTLGLESWAIDHLQGPVNVLALLCQERFLHQSAISHRDISNEQYNEIVRAGIKNFVAGKTNYAVTRRAEYGSAGESSRTRSIRQAQFWTNAPVDSSGDKARLQRQIGEIQVEQQEITEQNNALVEEHKEAKKQVNALQAEIDQLKKAKEDKQRTLTAWKALPTKLQGQEERLRAVQENLEGVRDRIVAILAEKDDYLIRRAENALEYAKAADSLKEAIEALLLAEMYHIEAQSDFDTLKNRNEGINNLLTTKTAENTEAANVAATENKKAHDFLMRVQRVVADAKELEKQGDRMPVDTARRLTDVSSDDLEGEITSNEAKLELIEGLDRNVIQEFERRAVAIEEIQGRLEKSSEDLKNARLSIKEIRELWEPRLDELVRRISEKFGESFARIGCAGQVVVFKASSEDVADDEDDSQNTMQDDQGNGLDFANWAIHISVKFRENEPLSLLDAHRQSGGERAVSTIFYLMALQSLSRAPFRVVDEINQGMDPRNERMVHGRMVDIATPNPESLGGGGDEARGGQYFLITPKLLSGLKYRRGMTVLCIVSGENMPEAIDAKQDGTTVGEGEAAKKVWKVDFRRFVARARKLGLAAGGEAGGRRVDSGVGLGSSFGSGTMDWDVNGEGARGVSVGA